MTDDKETKLNRLAKGLGAVRRGAVTAAKSGYFGAKNLAAETGHVIMKTLPVSLDVVREAIIAEMDEQEGTQFEYHREFADRVIVRLKKTKVKRDEFADHVVVVQLKKTKEKSDE